MKRYLIKFAKEIIEICKSNGITPILYGSYLVLHYTKNKKMNVNDIDFYVPEEFHKKMIKILKEKNIKYKYLKEWHCLQIFKDDLKVELDSIDYLYEGPKDFKDFDFK